MAWKVFDLYCGLGGLGLGFQRAGFEVTGGIDFWQPAVKANARLLGHEAHLEEVKNADQIILDSGWNADEGILTGGPPCQGFSLANQRRSANTNRVEVFNYVDLINRLKPAAFLLENVGGMRNTTKNADIAKSTVSDLVGGEYVCEARVLNASEYGVAQNRRRVIFIGFRKDFLDDGLNSSGRFPLPTHFDFCKKENSINERKGFAERTDENRIPQYWKERFFKTRISPDVHPLANRLPATSVQETIEDLPEISAGEASDVPNHVAGKISDIVDARISGIPPGGNVYHISKENLHGLEPEKSWYNYKRMNWVCRPAPAIPCEIRAANGYAHPIQNRAITPREAARLQGFPDDFVFEGPAKDQYRLIGNAVPPLLAQRIGESVLAVLNNL